MKAFFLMVEVEKLSRLNWIEPTMGWDHPDLEYTTDVSCACGNWSTAITLSAGKSVSKGGSSFNAILKCERCFAEGAIEILSSMGGGISRANKPMKVLNVEVTGDFLLKDVTCDFEWEAECNSGSRKGEELGTFTLDNAHGTGHEFPSSPGQTPPLVEGFHAYWEDDETEDLQDFQRMMREMA